jgi:hypothetical protein
LHEENAQHMPEINVHPIPDHRGLIAASSRIVMCASDGLKNQTKRIYEMRQTRHPQTHGKIERYEMIMKNVVKLEHCCSPDEFERAVAPYVDFYNNQAVMSYLKIIQQMFTAGKTGQILKEKT